MLAFLLFNFQLAKLKPQFYVVYDLSAVQAFNYVCARAFKLHMDSHSDFGDCVVVVFYFFCCYCFWSFPLTSFSCMIIQIFTLLRSFGNECTARSLPIWFIFPWIECKLKKVDKLRGWSCELVQNHPFRNMFFFFCTMRNFDTKAMVATATTSTMTMINKKKTIVN